MLDASLCERKPSSSTSITKARCLRKQIDATCFDSAVSALGEGANQWECLSDGRMLQGKCSSPLPRASPAQVLDSSRCRFAHDLVVRVVIAHARGGRGTEGSDRYTVDHSSQGRQGRQRGWGRDR